MAKNVVVLGAGGMAREMYWHIKALDPDARVVFVDDLSDTKEIAIAGEVITVVKDWKFDSIQGIKFEQFVLGTGSPETKKKLAARALESGLRPAATIVHPRAFIQGADCRIGVGGIISPGCVLTTNVQVGDFVLLNLNCTVGHDAILGDYVTCNPGCSLSGNVTLGEGVSLGTGTVVREKTSIAPGVVTGAQACVVKNVDEPNVTVIGVPAKKLG